MLFILGRHFLLRDVYDDMLLDGIQPVRDTFHSLIIGTMKGSRLQDAFFFRDEMKAMGLLPDVCFLLFLFGIACMWIILNGVPGVISFSVSRLICSYCLYVEKLYD